MSDKKKITFLSGGTGTPKLLLGFKEIIPEEQMVIIGNTGDDDEFYGLLVSPDIDTLLYLFSHQLLFPYICSALSASTLLSKYL